MCVAPGRVMYATCACGRIVRGEVFEGRGWKIRSQERKKKREKGIMG